jgi:hypothetical protein
VQMRALGGIRRELAEMATHRIQLPAEALARAFVGVAFQEAID